ncbi:hypothetical protein TWF696_005533 [Orbilia brochopaga]|uniref:TauD/TfdA-like domain-containing protein n=1 Tax=Orbilia brochopaga TaxID=3140254 RepID=A0AAV9V165_9PEZI
MQHIYQIIDCTSRKSTEDCEESILQSRQNKLRCTDFPEARSGDGMAAIFKRACALPIYTSPEFISHLQNVSNTLHTAVTDIVSRWWDDGCMLSTAIPFDPKIERILRRLDSEGPAWTTGSWRPDVLIENDTEGASGHPRIRICEINARFVFNGYFYGCGLSRYFGDNTSPVQPAFTGFDQSFRPMFDTTTQIHVLKGRETGYDVHNLNTLFGKQVVVANDISRLRIVKDGAKNRLMYAGDEEETEIFQIVLELHQDEILSLPEDIMWEVAIRTRTNDFRTIMFVHDKRMLGVVRQQLGDLQARAVLSPDAATLLENSLAETYLPQTPEYERAVKSDREQNWLFKPAGSGKGAGIVFRQDIPEEEWQALVSGSSQQVPHVLQRAVDQKRFDFYVPSDHGNSFKRVSWYLVGTFFNINGQFSGFGPWRCSDDKICALSKGGWGIHSVTDRACLPFPPNLNLAGHRHLQQLLGSRYDRYHATEGLDSAYHSDDGESTTSSENLKSSLVFPPKVIVADSAASGASPSHVAQVHQSLEEQGIALVRLNFEDPESDYLVRLVRDGLSKMYGHGLPVDHSQKKGWLWDVKPLHSKMENNTTGEPLARSETMNVFPWHTDCSFEDAPPRHFALHVLHADRYGGGALSIVRTKDIVQELSEETISRLSMPEFELNVPGEFDKGIGSLVGSLLDMSDNDPKLRYRRDIITPLTRQAQVALDELDAVLDDCRSKKVMKAEDLPDGMVIVLDNAKWLHARNQVNDPNRHLRRVRWNAQPFPSN